MIGSVAMSLHYVDLNKLNFFKKPFTPATVFHLYYSVHLAEAIDVLPARILTLPDYIGLTSHPVVPLPLPLLPKDGSVGDVMIIMQRRSKLTE